MAFKQRLNRFSRILAAVAALAMGVSLAAQAPQAPPQPHATQPTNYVVGPQDVLSIVSYDQADLSGKFAVDADGTFTFPLIGRFRAGGLTLRAVEEGLRNQLKSDGYFKNPTLSVSVEQYRSQKVFIVGEVRSPGSYPVTGDMNLVEALARAGSTLPTASGEAIIVHPSAGQKATGPVLPTQDAGANIVRVDLRELQNGAFSNNAALRDGDTIFVPRAESIYVFGQVKNPGAYPLQQRSTTVLQALSLAGGVAERGSTSRIRIVRIEKGDKKELKVTLGDTVQPGDTIIVPERIL